MLIFWEWVEGWWPMINDDNPVSGGVFVFLCSSASQNIPVYHLGSSWNGNSDSGSLGGVWNSACLTSSWMTPNSKARFSPQRPTGCGFLHHPAYPSWCRNLSTGAMTRWALGLCPGVISAEDSLSQRGRQAWMVFTLDQDFSLIKPLIIRLVCRIEQS